MPRAKALSLIAEQVGEKLETIAQQAEAEIVSGSSLKAAKDRDWDDPEAKKEALGTILQTLTQVESWVAREKLETEEVEENLEAARQIKTQDVEVTSEGEQQIKKGVAQYRRISIEDAQMRHGRKSRIVSQPIASCHLFALHNPSQLIILSLILAIAFLIDDTL